MATHGPKASLGAMQRRQYRKKLPRNGRRSRFAMKVSDDSPGASAYWRDDHLRRFAGAAHGAGGTGARRQISVETNVHLPQPRCALPGAGHHDSTAAEDEDWRAEMRPLPRPARVRALAQGSTGVAESRCLHRLGAPGQRTPLAPTRCTCRALTIRGRRGRGPASGRRCPAPHRRGPRGARRNVRASPVRIAATVRGR